MGYTRPNDELIIFKGKHIPLGTYVYKCIVANLVRYMKVIYKEIE